jgi:hypothetical protein
MLSMHNLYTNIPSNKSINIPFPPQNTYTHSIIHTHPPGSNNTSAVSVNNATFAPRTAPGGSSWLPLLSVMARSTRPTQAAQVMP